MQIEPDFLQLLETLCRHDVEYIVCGGIAAILHGAPLMTADLDVVYNASRPNRRRLLAAVEELGATYFDVAGRHIVPDLEKLASLRMHLLNTRYGRLDLLREIGDGLGYSALVDRSRTLDLEGMKIRVLDLDAIIESKEVAGRAKDLASLPFLKALQKLDDE